MSKMSVSINIKPKAEGSEVSEIQMEENNNIFVTFDIDTVEEYAFDRTGNIANTLTITGEIKEETKNQAKELLKWALGLEKEVYRIVSVKFTDASENILRGYELDNAFIADYKEVFEGSQLKYTAKISQRKENMSNIRVR